MSKTEYDFIGTELRAFNLGKQEAYQEVEELVKYIFRTYLKKDIVEIRAELLERLNMLRNRK